jgi:hypothetical protein
MVDHLVFFAVREEASSEEVEATTTGRIVADYEF